MNLEPEIAAHLIVGDVEEPYLAAVLEALVGVARVLLVNDNASTPDGPNARAIAASPFGRDGRTAIDRSPFVDFATARNRVIALHRRLDAGTWAAPVDADDVHRPLAARIARNLSGLPPEIARVDGYQRHLVQSFRWFGEIGRRCCFFRVGAEARYENGVHEVLIGLDGRALAIPYVYEHYGLLSPLRALAAKGRLYSALGQAGETIADAEVDAVDRDAYFAPQYRLAMRFDTPHAPAIERRRTQFARQGARCPRTDAAIVRAQSPSRRAANAVRRVNYALRVGGRALHPLARALVRGG